jgi:transposase
MQIRVALARDACRLCYALLRTQQPYDEARYPSGPAARAVTADTAMPHDGAT